MQEQDYRNAVFRQFTPYTPGEQPTGSDWVKLNTNESPLPPSPRVLARLQELAAQPDLLRKYPHPLGEPLRSRLAQKWGIRPEQLVLVNGSDEILSLVCRVVLEAGEPLLFPEVSYSLYETLARSVGARPAPVPMQARDANPFAVDLQALEKASGRLVFLPNPNAPTGELVDLDELSSVIAASEKLWLIDEAYNDFARPRPSSFMTRLARHNNVIVTRTFSKSYGLAGLRLGYAASVNQTLMQALLAAKDSYNCDALSLQLGLAASEDEEYLGQTVNLIQSERDRVKNSLSARGYQCLATEANFLLARPAAMPAAEILQRLKQKKILVRHFAASKVADYLRITIGLPEENDALLAALAEVEKT